MTVGHLRDQSAADVPLQTIMDTRGYLVMASDTTLEPGQTVDIDGKFQVAVLSETDWADLEEQGKAWGHKAQRGWSKHYYRVVAE